MMCPQCNRENYANAPVKSCQCGYNAFGAIKVKPCKQRSGEVGTELKKLIPSVLAKSGCGCNDYAANMNYWGIEGCTERYDEIVEHLVKQAKTTKLGRLSETLDKAVAKRWLTKAIANAQRNEDGKR